MPSFDHYFYELQKQLRRAAEQGMTSIVITSGELHLAVGGNSGFMENCIEAMEAEMGGRDELLVVPDSNSGISVRYALPRIIQSR